MRENRDNQAITPVRKAAGKSDALKRPLWTLALGLAMVPVFAASAWAETYPLESVDFTSAGNQTHIMLHTGSIVPVQKVLVSNEKLILEIDQIDADETIRTNFTGAGNISHVIVQPVNEHKIRMIIRGEHLGTPTLAFFNAGNGAYSAQNANYNGSPLGEEAGLQSSMPADQNAAPDAFSGTVAPLSANATAKPSAQSAGNADWAALLSPNDRAGNGNMQAKNVAQAASKDLPILGQGIQKPRNDKSPLSLPESQPKNSSDMLDTLLSGPLTTYLPAGLLGVLLLGLGLFIRNRLRQIGGNAPQLEDLIEEQAQGKRVSFREMASAYRNKRDTAEIDPAEALGKANGRKSNAEDVIGLRSLHQMEAEWDEVPVAKPQPKSAKPAATRPMAASAATPAPTPSLEQLLAAMQKTQAGPKPPIQAPAPKKQALNPYAQAQGTKPKSKSREAAEQKVFQELERAQQIREEVQKQIAAQDKMPVNRALAANKSVKPAEFKMAPATSPVNAKKRPPQNIPVQTRPASQARPVAARSASPEGPLPGNPEVLNFLRNVAELMEKDGKTDIAKNIHRNLGAPT